MVDELVKVFISYAREDEALLKELSKHLKSLESGRRGIVSSWHSGMLQPGIEWDDETKAQLNTADIILLLISHNFIDSDYHYNTETRRAIERHEAQKACVIPIVLRPVHLDFPPFDRLQALPKDAKAITTWADKNEAFKDVVAGIEAVASRLIEERRRRQNSWNYKTQQGEGTFTPIPTYRLKPLELEYPTEIPSVPPIGNRSKPLELEYPTAISSVPFSEDKRSSNDRRYVLDFPWCGMAKTFLAYSIIGFISAKASTPLWGIASVVALALVGALTGTYF